MTDPDFDVDLVRAALTLAAEKGWRRVTVASAAHAGGLSLALARVRFPDRCTILMRLGQMLDQAVLAEPPAEGPVRDTLFDLLMRRFDGLQRHRNGVIAVLHALPYEPATALVLACATRRGMRWMLDAAGVETTGLIGELRVRGLVAVWMWAVRAWERDGSEDMSQTMAALDAALRRAEGVASWLSGSGRPTAEAVVEEPGQETDAPTA